MFCRCIQACLCGGSRSPSSSGYEEAKGALLGQRSVHRASYNGEPLSDESSFPMDPLSDDGSYSEINLPAPSSGTLQEHPRIDFGFFRDDFREGMWLQTRGAQVIRWIEDPADPDCPIPRNSLTVKQLENEARLEVPKDNAMVLDLEFPENFKLLAPWQTYRVYFGKNTWIGHVTPGAIILQNISRTHESPNVSEITLTAYYREYETVEDLRHIFFTTIENPQTRYLVTEGLYPSWPDAPTMTWEHGTSEFEQILGTRLGRLAAYIVLGGFNRGTRRIARVVSSSPCLETLDLRFDIELI